MTRFQIIGIFEDEIYTSIEFNGDGYFDGWGYEVCEGFETCKTFNDYKELVNKINNDGFNYKENLIYNDVVKDDFNFNHLCKEHQYFDIWFSDYLYIKNFTKNDFEVIDEKGSKIIIHPAGYLTLYFGKYYTPSSEDLKLGNPHKNIYVNLKNELYEIIENLSWDVEEETDKICISRYTPAGEDYCFYVDKSNILEDIRNEAENFDAEDHALTMLGSWGAPSIRALLNDADWIQAELWDLVEAIENA